MGLIRVLSIRKTTHTTTLKNRGQEPESTSTQHGITVMPDVGRPVVMLGVAMICFSAINFAIGINMLGERGRDNKVRCRSWQRNPATSDNANYRN